MSNISHVITEASIFFVAGGQSRSVGKGHPAFDDIKALLKKGFHDQNTVSELLELADTKLAIKKKSGGSVVVTDKGVTYKGKPMHGVLVQRMMDLYAQKKDFSHLANFMARCEKNKTPKAIEELYEFLEKSNMPISPDGRFFAFKKVNSDYKDYYTGQFDNSVGKIPKMEFSEVDKDRNRTCSRGLHWCSWDYLPHYHGSAGRVMVVLVDPADVGAIPTDYNRAKGRSSKYTVVGEVDESLAKTVFSGQAFVSKFGVYDDSEYDSDAEDFDDPAPASVEFEKDGKTYTAQEVLDLVNVHGTTGAAAKVGVHRDTIRRWVKKAESFKEDSESFALNKMSSEPLGSSTVGEVIKAISENSSYSEAASSLGVHPDTLRKWRKKIIQRGDDLGVDVSKSVTKI